MLLKKRNLKNFLLGLLFVFFSTRGNEEKMGTLAKVIIHSAAATVCVGAAFGCAKATKYFFEQSVPPYENLKSSLKNFKKLKQLKKLKDKIIIKQKDLVRDTCSLAKNGGTAAACAAGMMATAVLAGVFLLSIPFTLYDKYHRSQTI